MYSPFARVILGSALILLGMVAAGIGVGSLLRVREAAPLPSAPLSEKVANDVSRVDEAFRSSWKAAGLSPAPRASSRTVARRLSLALTGAVPSFEEIRRLEETPQDDVTRAWLDHLFADQRYRQYFAERLARAYVGVETGPFLVYRRRRMVNWLSEQLAVNRPYDELAREMIAAEGLWTTNPGTNFITVAVIQNGKNKGPDEVKLASRTSRAFLGVSLDCMQCHDDKFGDRWKQEDFHRLAAFFSQSEMSLTGVRENPKRSYQARFNGDEEDTVVSAEAPFSADLMPESGHYRERLAAWITHPENRSFARAMVNRTWALLFGRGLIDPIDNIPVEGPFPPGMETLADIFIENDFDLQHLIRVVVASEPFQLDSSSGDTGHPVTAEQEMAWAAFPVTPLRPEQVAGSVIQASTLTALDGETHIFHKLRRFGETKDFVKRYGDPGENEFEEEAGTIPQRLLLMNGKLVSERTKPSPMANSATRLAHYADKNSDAINAAFLATLTREPNDREREHFVALLHGTKNKSRERVMQDVFWALINSTEFSWNR